MLKFIELLNTRGLQIDFGSQASVCLTRDNAIVALELLREEGAIVLGGDVFKLLENKFTPAYANWHCDEISAETKQAFSQRSILVALDYIKNYPKELEEAYFIFVIQ